MNYVNSQQAGHWFQPGYAPQAAAQQDGSYQVSFRLNPDQYRGSAERLATQAAPYAPGAVAGYLAKQGVQRGLRIAKTARNARYRSKAYNGRYGSSRGAVNRRTSTRRSSGSMFEGLLGAIKNAALFGGILSLVSNGQRVMRKELTVAQAGTNVAGDVTAATVGGAAGAVASAVGTPILASMFGPASLLVTLGGIGLGVGGYVLADRWLRGTPFFQNLTHRVQGTLAAFSR